MPTALCRDGGGALRPDQPGGGALWDPLSVRRQRTIQGAAATGGLSEKCLENDIQRIWTIPEAGETGAELAQRLGLANAREKLAVLTGQFAPEGPEAQGIIDEN